MDYKAKYEKYKCKYVNLKGVVMVGGGFVMEKKRLLKQLSFYEKKLVYPLGIIKDLEEGGMSKMATCVENYNKRLLKIKELYESLYKLQKWDVGEDSYSYWKKLVEENVELIKKVEICFDDMYKLSGEEKMLFLNSMMRWIK